MQDIILDDVAVKGMITMQGLTTADIAIGEWEIKGIGEKIQYAKRNDAPGTKTGVFMSFNITHKDSGTVRRVSSFDLARFLLGVKGDEVSTTLTDALQDDKSVKVNRTFNVLESHPQFLEGTKDTKTYPKTFYTGYKAYQAMKKANTLDEDDLMATLRLTGVDDKNKEKYYRQVTIDPLTPTLEVVNKA